MQARPLREEVPPASDDALLPVTVRYRMGGELLEGGAAPRDVAGVLACRGLVVEVHPLPAPAAGVGTRAAG